MEAGAPSHPPPQNVETKDADPDPKPTKTVGRTPDGTTFTVPTTHDMVSQLLDPRQPKNLSDAVVLAILASHITLLYLLPWHLKRQVFAVVFLLWRASYNLGIGLLLRAQSNDNKLVIWAKKWKLFENPLSGSNPRPWLYNLLKRELETKIPADYVFEKSPLEYNTWLVFRRLVDLILMCDFVSYCLFAIACTHQPDGETLAVTAARWLLGLSLIGFNLWVKLDAHRVVKDYAWYWGDFFYLIDQELTFDGVFEMAPHPMYSIGYAGYYGISMLAASYSVLFISIVAHAAQFAFLYYFESPHIEKIYNPPTPRKRADAQNSLVAQPVHSTGAAQPAATEYPLMPLQQESPVPVHKLLGLRNFDLFRTTDYSTALLIFYQVALTLVTPDSPKVQFLFVLHAFAWRLWYYIGLGFILHLQSTNKMWTRHFLKFGDGIGEAWNQWKAMYHISQLLTYTSFIAACWKVYSFPHDWDYGFVALKHIVGSGLIALHIWTSVSIYDSLGEFGWFCGDFFFDRGAKLTYTSIYRFLNNPERIIGTAGLWGAALITWNKSIMILALTGHLLTLTYLEMVEKPHMSKIYKNIRKEAGLTKFIKSSLPPPVKEWGSSVNKVMDGTSLFVEDFLETAGPKLAAGVSTIVRDTTALFNNVPARLTLTRLSPDLAGFNPKDYSLTVHGEPATHSAITEQSTGKEGTTARFPYELNTMILEYGAPIKVMWTAPADHGKKDWIGLYMVADNRSREATEVSSRGRWIPTTPGQYDSLVADKGILLSDKPSTTVDSSDGNLVRGEVLFEGDKMWWTRGVFEFRYHHNGGHSVMKISQPFEIHIGRFDEEDIEVDSQGLYQKSVESALLPLVKNCFDRDPDIAPNTSEESFGGHVERDGKYARRVVYGIKEMFGIDFAPAVVRADGNVKNLAWRICNAKQALAPYSMSHSKGTTTPAAEKELASTQEKGAPPSP
ncbi:phosphatidylethanolamine N-methyltransferase [Pseudomassariella vexata]|uniref:Phosphatidylethanolamine N-methyltransferase n=1 Tax=Pseudomassariella vexata TaxID=1141098 RepID=A0A1Y2DWG2_9PEZI|nr:phosphatidylethanolamine N-methyltransferase [Pseudomassariella vexata]ORY62955.1 phosphatidylethanolamine N-methyltransferase [Pseudomassariella vexata]